jgi:hypothetical protein
MLLLKNIKHTLLVSSKNIQLSGKPYLSEVGSAQPAVEYTAWLDRLIPFAQRQIFKPKIMCDIKTLCIKNQAHISHCAHCQTVYIWHNNLLLNFSPKDFQLFHETLLQQRFYDCCMLFPDGEERVVVHSPCRDISFTFTQAEWQDMRDAMEEAVLMQQVYELIR